MLWYSSLIFCQVCVGEGGADNFDDVASEEGTEAGGGTETATFGEGVEETC